MDLQVSPSDILMILDGHARTLSAALANPQGVDTAGIKSHIARMYAYADKLHEANEAATKQNGKEEAKAN